jgi:hypothetical protein
MMRKLLVAGTAALLSVALSAGPAAAKKAPEGDLFPATIDCGDGPVDVVSTADIFAPLVDVETGKKYKPLHWEIVFDGETLTFDSGKKIGKHAVGCAYDDGMAVGTVTVKKA